MANSINLRNQDNQAGRSFLVFLDGKVDSLWSGSSHHRLLPVLLNLSFVLSSPIWCSYNHPTQRFPSTYKSKVFLPLNMSFTSTHAQKSLPPLYNKAAVCFPYTNPVYASRICIPYTHPIYASGIRIQYTHPVHVSRTHNRTF